MRTYEERMAEARKKALNEENEYGLSLEGYQETGSEVANDAASDNSSAYDVVSETSSELQQPSIDTQKLDRQIKSVMMVGYQHCIHLFKFLVFSYFLNFLYNLFVPIAFLISFTLISPQVSLPFQPEFEISFILQDLIPFLNEHMESHCNPKFLSELNTLIFKLAKQKEPGAEKQVFISHHHFVQYSICTLDN